MKTAFISKKLIKDISKLLFICFFTWVLILPSYVFAQPQNWDEDFIAGNYNFKQNPNESLSYIITTASDDAVVLATLSATLSASNEGSLIVSLDKTPLPVRNEVTLTFAGNELLNFVVDSRILTDSTGVKTAEIIFAKDEEIALTVKVVRDVLKAVVNNKGIIEAKRIVKCDGRIFFEE